jgi:hypothetical protein
MAHAVPPPKTGRSWQWQQTFGAVLVVIGLVVAVIAVVALSKPHGKSSEGTGVVATGTGVPPPPVTDSGSASTSPTATSSGSKSSAPATSGSKSSSGSKTSAPATAATSAAAARPSVAILNDTTINGLGAQAQADLTAQGWTVISATTYTNNIASTCAYYDPSDPANEAAALVLQQQFPWIKRVKERFAELPSAPIVLVITASY